MPSIKVPEEHVSGFSRIMRLSSDETDRVVAALEKAKSTNLREIEIRCIVLLFRLIIDLCMLVLPNLPYNMIYGQRM